MKKTTLVAFLLIFSHLVSANTLSQKLHEIEKAWATNYYEKSTRQQSQNYPNLIDKTQKLLSENPDNAEIKIWLAILLSTYAEFQDPFSALSSLDKAKSLLETSIREKPGALEGAAYITLGTLYYMTPSWPISFGNDEVAESLLKKGLKHSPYGLDSNYFYADFLLNQNRKKEAIKYFIKASQAPIRAEQAYHYKQLRKDAVIALNKAGKRNSIRSKQRFLSNFSTAKNNINN